jgi:hypothetical protein
MMNMTEEDWQTFAMKTILYVGFPMATSWNIPLHDVPLFSASENEEKFCCLVIDKDHKWSFHFRKSLRENYSLPRDKALIIFRGVLKEKLPDGKWKPIDSFKYEFTFDGNDISFEREIPSEVLKIQESYLRNMDRL